MLDQHYFLDGTCWTALVLRKISFSKQSMVCQSYQKLSCPVQPVTLERVKTRHRRPGAKFAMLYSELGSISNFWRLDQIFWILPHRRDLSVKFVRTWTTIRMRRCDDWSRVQRQQFRTLWQVHHRIANRSALHRLWNKSRDHRVWATSMRKVTHEVIGHQGFMQFM